MIRSKLDYSVVKFIKQSFIKNERPLEDELIQHGYKGSLPEIDSHLFFTSRDYDGPNKEALSVGANSVPKQTRWDLQRAWESISKQLPVLTRRQRHLHNHR